MFALVSLFSLLNFRRVRPMGCAGAEVQHLFRFGGFTCDIALRFLGLYGENVGFRNGQVQRHFFIKHTKVSFLFC